MRVPHKQNILWILAGCLMVGAGYLCLYTWRQTGVLTRKLDRLHETALQMRDLAATAQADRACLETFNALPDKTLTSVRELLLSAVPGTAARVNERAPEPMIDGWTLHRVDITFDTIPLKAMSRFIMAAEQERPPWRISECSIIASDKQAGHGRVSLLLEGLEQKDGP
ncbi:MAG: hypothetical protein EOM20_00900 [Spartobacteria bacterium]|nr:hypothetical protein [Spartobacteria bacterium]